MATPNHSTSESQLSTSNSNTQSSLPSQPSATSSFDWWSSPRQPLDFFQTAASASVVSEPQPQHEYFASSPFSFFSNSPGTSDKRDEQSANPFGDDGPASPAMLFLSGFTPSSRSNSFCPGDFSTSNEPVKVKEEDIQELKEDVVGGYVLGDIIGHGGFSVVRRATLQSSGEHSHAASVAAVKIVRKSLASSSSQEAKDALRRLEREINIWSKLSHEHILPLFQNVETSVATYLFTLYCPGGSLLDIVNSHKDAGGVSMDDAGMMFRQIVRGLRYLHEHVRLVHGDIKLENVLVDDMGSCRIADFGLSRWMEDPTPNASAHSSITVTPAEPDDESEPSTSSLERLGGKLPPQRQLLHLSLHRAHRRAAGHGGSKKFRGSTTPLAPLQLPNHPHEPVFPPGSLPYASPELLAPHSHPLKPNSAQDIWALGCILYALLFGKLPFWDAFEPRLQMKIVRGAWKLPSPVGRAALSRSRKSLGSSKGRRSRSRSVARSPVSPRFSHGPSTSRQRSKSRGRSRGSSANTPSNHPSQRTSIGKVAERVLKGCLCLNVKDRWTVSMIDEVGWAVGWDLDVDSAEEIDEEYLRTQSSISVMKSPTIEEDAVYEIRGPAVLDPHAEAAHAVADANWASSGSPSEGTRSSTSLQSFDEMAQSPIDESSPQDRRKSSRSRGKRGKASRSSSRVASGNTSPSSSGASSPSGSVPPADPFAAFRQGHIPPSLKALTSYTQNSSNSSLVYSRSPVVSRDHSRASSREPSRVRESTSSNAYAQFKQGRAPLTLTVTYSPPTSRNQSRAGSSERNGGPEKDRPSRGRSIGTSSWRMASLSGSPAASSHQTTSQSQGPPPSSTLTSFPSIGSLTTAPSLSSVSNGPHTNTSSTSPPPPWARRLSQNHLREERASGDSESPCTSPTPVTPIDGTEERRSRSRGRKRHHEAPRQQRTDAEAFLDSWGSS